MARLCAFALALLLTPQAQAFAQTIPVWQSSFTFNGIIYNIQHVGSNPAHGGKTTLIANTIVPMRIIFADGMTLDALDDVHPLLASPIYSNSAFQSGTTQYADAVLRAKLW